MRLALALLAVLAFATSAAAQTITGRASVIDGDTVEISGRRIRLHGVDTPESAQTCQDAGGKSYRCGQQAALALADKIGTATVSCEVRDTDRYGRSVATCRAGGENLNAWLVSQGHAVAYRQYGTEYVPQEREAQGAKRGIWVGTFVPPADYRRGKREGTGMAAAPSPNSPASADCRIKGNISSSGEKIYHVPGGRDYERTTINERSGERMFCSEDEAQAAGWRAARGEKPQ